MMANTVNDMYVGVAQQLQEEAVEIPSRNGNTHEIHPAAYGCDDFSNYMLNVRGRVINFPFALAELIWIMNGSDDEWITFYNKQMTEYMNEDGKGNSYFNAAYGYRLKHAFSIDQIQNVINHFDISKDTRHAVMVYSHPVLDDAMRSLKDRACNIASMYLIREGKLDLTQAVRSHDFVWGLPYNLMQFGYITQHIAEQINVPVGKVFWLSNSLHVYNKYWKDMSNISMNVILSEYNMFLPSIGKNIDHTLLYAQERFIRTKESVNEYNYLKIYRDHVRDINSPFWHDGLLVLMSYRVKHDPFVAIKLLDLIHSDLFRLMALRYYLTYWKNKWGNLNDGENSLAKIYLRDRYNDKMIIRWLGGK